MQGVSGFGCRVSIFAPRIRVSGSDSGFGFGSVRVSGPVRFRAPPHLARRADPETLKDTKPSTFAVVLSRFSGIAFRVSGIAFRVSFSSPGDRCGDLRTSRAVRIRTAGFGSRVWCSMFRFPCGVSCVWCCAFRGDCFGDLRTSRAVRILGRASDTPCAASSASFGVPGK